MKLEITNPVIKSLLAKLPEDRWVVIAEGDATCCDVAVLRDSPSAHKIHRERTGSVVLFTVSG